jgi:hypothetical protein
LQPAQIHLAVLVSAAEPAASAFPVGTTKSFAGVASRIAARSLSST